MSIHHAPFSFFLADPAATQHLAGTVWGFDDLKNLTIGILSSIIAAILLVVLGNMFSRKAKWIFIALFSRFVDVDIEYVFRNHEEAEPDIERELKKATFVYLLTCRGNGLQRNAFLTILNRQSKGRLKEFKVLLPSLKLPRGQFSWVDQREHELASFDPAFGSGILRKQIQTTIEFLGSYVGRGDIELRFFSMPHIARILITDRYVYLTPYTSDAHGRDSRIIKHRRGGEMYEMLLRLFNQLWNAAPNQGPSAPTASQSDLTR